MLPGGLSLSTSTPGPILSPPTHQSPFCPTFLPPEVTDVHPWAGGRSCCPNATWGLPRRLLKCISQLWAGGGSTRRPLSRLASRESAWEYRVHLSAGEERRGPALALRTCSVPGTRVSGLWASVPPSIQKGVSLRCCLWPLPAPRPPWQTHTPPYPWIQPQLLRMLLNIMLFPEGRWPSEDSLPEPQSPTPSPGTSLGAFPISSSHESGARPSSHRPLPQQAWSQSLSQSVC